MKSQRGWWLAGLVAAAVLAWVGYRQLQPEAIEVVRAEGGPAERVLAITGRTRPQVTVTIVPKVAGQIVKLTKEEGERVSAGELLVQLDADAPKAAVEQAESEMAAQKRAVVEAQRNFDRTAQLRGQGLATQKEYDQAKFDLDQALAETNRRAASLRETSARLADATIRAPVSGVVLARPVDRGQVVSAQSTIYEIAPLADVEVEADVDERYLTTIREGLKADVLIAGSSETLPATLYYISPKVDVRTGGAKVRLRLDRQIDGLRSGVTADVNLIVERVPESVTIARSAILGRDETARVLVVKDGRVESRPIRYLEWPSERVIVQQGLEPGETAVAQPRAELVGKRVAGAQAAESAARAL